MGFGIYDSNACSHISNVGKVIYKLTRMKQGWEIKKLGEVVTFQRGLTYSKNDEVELSCNGVLRSNNIDLDTMSLVFDELKYVREDLVIAPDKKLSKGSILICMSNGSKQHLGKVAFIDKDYDYAFGGFMGLIKPNDDICAKYIYYTCISSSYKHFLAGVGCGANITNLKFADLAQYIIPVPERAEQERIVGELDCLSGIIAAKRAQLRELDTLAQSIFYTMFGDPITNDKGWQTKTLGDVCDTTSGGTPSKKHAEYYENGTIPWLRSGEIDKTFISSTELCITEQGVKNSSAKWFPINTVVIAMYGATVGQVGILKAAMTTNQAICGIFPNDIFAPVYLYYFLRSMKTEFIKLSSGGAQPNISLSIIRDTIVSCPPILMQQQYAETINQGVNHRNRRFVQ